MVVVGLLPKMFRRSLFLAQMLLLTALPALAQEEPALQLKLHWMPGYTYVQESETDTTNFLTALGKTSDQTLRLHQSTRITAQKNSQGETEAKVLIEHLLGEMKVDGKSHFYDSKNPGSAHPVLQRTLGGAAGRGFTLVYNAEDEFLDAKDTGSMVEGGPTPDLASLATARQLATLFRRSLEIGLPKIPVRPRDKWVSDEVVPFSQAGTVQVKLNAKFDGVVDREGRQQARVSFEGVMKSQRDKDTAGRELDTSRPVTLGGESKVSGHVFYDLEWRTIAMAVFVANLQLNVEGKTMPVRQEVATRLVSIQATPTP